MSTILKFETSDKQIIECNKDDIVPFAKNIETLLNEGKITADTPYTLEKVNAESLNKILEFIALFKTQNAKASKEHEEESDNETDCEDWELEFVQKIDETDFRGLLLASAVLQVEILRKAIYIRFKKDGWLEELQKKKDSESRNNSINLKFGTSDGQIIEVDQDDIVPYSKHIETLLNEGKITANTPYALEKVDAENLYKILDYIAQFKAEFENPTEAGQEVVVSVGLSCKAWELEFVEQFGENELVDLILAVEFLEVQTLETAGCIKVANDMKERLLREWAAEEDSDSDGDYNEEDDEDDEDKENEDAESLEEQLFRLLI